MLILSCLFASRMDGECAPRFDFRGYLAIGDNDPYRLLIIWPCKNQQHTHVVPVHDCPDGPPDTTSQYEPSGRDVENVVFQALSLLLMATNPTEPDDSPWKVSIGQCAVEFCTCLDQTQCGHLEETPSSSPSLNQLHCGIQPSQK
jgi:hypothetical protein